MNSTRLPNPLHASLRLRFALWTAGLLLAALVLFGALVYFNMARGLASAIDNSLELSAAQATASLVENNQLSLADGLPASATIASLNDRGNTIRVLNLDGSVLAAAGLYSNLATAPEAIDATLAQHANFSTIRDSSELEPIRFLTTPITTINGTAAVLQVGQSLDSVNDTLEQLLTILVVAIPLLVGVSAAGGYLLAGRALAPINSITELARRISANDLHERIALPPTNDEVGRLGSTFDTMLDRLAASFQRERQFTANASHELRTPLTAMQTMISVLREQRRTNDEYEHALEDFGAQTSRMRTIVEDLLQLARMDAGVRQVSMPVDMSAMLEDMCDSLAGLAEAKGIDIFCRVDAGLTMNGDGDSMIRLFVNLIDNAIKFSNTGDVLVQAHREGSRILVEIADSGVGIDGNHLPHVFDRFYRADHSRTIEGSGLGLSIAEAVVKAHGGTIEIASQSGKGTRVLVGFSIDGGN